jgi:cholesterol transport system auxiliary component
MRSDVDEITVTLRPARAASGIFLLAFGLLAGCAALPDRAAAPLQYDFGPPVEAQSAVPPLVRPALALHVQASPALEGSAMFYRLGYAEPQQLRTYTLARWAMPPGELLQQRLRAGLTGQFAVLRPGEGAPRLLLVELVEFSQVFDSPTQSSGLVHLRATVLQQPQGGKQPPAQRELLLRRPAASADAAAGVQALGVATDAAAQELLQWLHTLQ